ACAALYVYPVCRQHPALRYALERTAVFERCTGARRSVRVVRGENVCELQRSACAADFPLLDLLSVGAVCGIARGPLRAAGITRYLNQSPRSARRFNARPAKSGFGATTQHEYQ